MGNINPVIHVRSGRYTEEKCRKNFLKYRNSCNTVYNSLAFKRFGAFSGQLQLALV